MSAKRRQIPSFAAIAGLFVLLEPRLAAANTGTALMWAGALHLMFGNACIGVIEGLFLARYWGVRPLRAVLVSIVGNYVAWWSYSLLQPVFGYVIATVLGDSPLPHLKEAIALTMLLAFACSVILEAPFSYVVSRSPKRRDAAASVRWKRLLAGHLMAQSITYSLLAAWYVLASNASLLRIPVRPELSGKLPPGWLYFEDHAGRCERRRLAGGSIEACPGPRGPADPNSFMQVRSLDPTTQWTVSTGDWAQGLFAHSVDGRNVTVALDTPVIRLQSSYPTILPQNLVVYQIGDDIVVLDLAHAAIDPLVRGHRPSVELD